jgi:hypothetical protein
VRTKACWHARVTQLRGASGCARPANDLYSPSTALQAHCMHIEALAGLRVHILPAQGYRVRAPVQECRYQADMPHQRQWPFLTVEQAPICNLCDKNQRDWASGSQDITSTVPLQNARHSRSAFRGIHMFWHGSDHSNTHSVLPRTPNGPNQVVHARKKSIHLNLATNAWNSTCTRR